MNENFFLKIGASLDLILNLIKNTIPNENLLTDISNENEIEIQKILFNQRLVLNIQNNNIIHDSLECLFKTIFYFHLNRDYYMKKTSIQEYFDNEEKIVSFLIKNAVSLPPKFFMDVSHKYDFILDYDKIMNFVIIVFIQKGNINLIIFKYDQILKELEQYRHFISHKLKNFDEREDDEVVEDEIVYNNRSNILRDDPRLKLKQKYLKIQTIFEITVLIQNVDVMINMIKIQMKIRSKIYSF